MARKAIDRRYTFEGRKYRESGRFTDSMFGDGKTVVGDPRTGDAWLASRTVKMNGKDTGMPYPVPDGLPILVHEVSCTGCVWCEEGIPGQDMAGDECPDCTHTTCPVWAKKVKEGTNMPRKSNKGSMVEQMVPDSKKLEAVDEERVARKRTQAATGGLQQKFLGLIQEFKAGLIERDDVVDAVALAVLSGNHVFMLGPPGTAKSLVLEEFSKALGGTRFRTLAMKYSTPEQFFGPLSLQGLKQDRYVRKSDNYLPSAHFAFVDEIWKANAGVLNATLTIMQERLYEVDGKMEKVPLITLMAASNELPQEAELAPLHDRFLVRIQVDRIRDPANKIRLLLMKPFVARTQLALTDLQEAHAEIGDVDIPEAVAALAAEIHDAVLAQGIPASDRRFRNSMDLVRAHAWLNGRDTATVSDLAPLRFVFWDQPEQIAKVADIVMEKVNPLERKAREVFDEIVQALKGIEKKPQNERMLEATEILPRVNESLDKLEAVVKEARAAGHDPQPILAVLQKAEKMNEETYNKYIGTKIRKRGA